MAKSKIDKESMFNKLMPSNTNQNKTTVAELGGMRSSPAALNQAAPPAAAPPASIPDADPPIPVLPSSTGTALVNVMERIIAGKLDQVFNKFNCCKCQRCRQDVAAIALNKVKPKYVIASESEIEEITAKQNTSDVMSALVQAILIVIAHPRH